MLINSSHPTPSKAPIPATLLDIYVRYKQDTRAIIAWLIRHGGTRKDRYCQKTTVSIGDLLWLAQRVTSQTKREVVTMPETVEYCFREAIAARTQLSGFFRKSGGDGGGGVDLETSNHEFFTAR